MVTIYVLKLRGNKYYVGKTTNPTYRLDDHFSESGSAWTKKYKPISIHELKPDRPDSDEQIVTQEYMQKYGIDNVRGGPWCKINLSGQEKQMITQLCQSNSDSCYTCGKAGHFASKCRQDKRQGKGKQKTTYAKLKPTNLREVKREAAAGRIQLARVLAEVAELKAEVDMDSSHTSTSAALLAPTICVCERCGRSGHTLGMCNATTDYEGYELECDDDSDEEYYESSEEEDVVCYRCGRPGHTKPNCYAGTHVKGYELYY